MNLAIIAPVPNWIRSFESASPYLIALSATLVFVLFALMNIIMSNCVEKLFEQETAQIAEWLRLAKDCVNLTLQGWCRNVWLAVRKRFTPAPPWYRAHGPFRYINGRKIGCVYVAGGFPDESVTVYFVPLDDQPLN